MNTTSFMHVAVLLVWLAYLVAVVWVIVLTWRNTTMTLAVKLVWTIVLVVVPIIGLLLWLLARLGAHKKHRPSA